MVQRGYECYGEIFSIRLPGIVGTFLLSPEGHEAFFNAPGDQLNQRDFYKMMVPIFGKGIAYDVSPEIMDEQLSLIQGTLRGTLLQSYAQAMVEEADLFFSSWGDEGEVDLLQLGNHLTLCSATRCLLGKQFREEVPIEEFSELYHRLQYGINIIATFAPNLPIPSFIRRDRARAELGRLIGQILQKRRNSRVVHQDVLQKLMETHYSDGRPFSDEEIIGWLVAMIFAGHHTSGVTFAWNIILLHQNQAYLDRVLLEQKGVSEENGKSRLEQFKEMILLGNSIKETLRLHPPLIFLMRKVLKPFVYKGYTLPKGSMAIVSPKVGQRLDTVFSQPELYDPDRFSASRAEDKKTPMAMIPFGGGRRICMGMEFAQLQLKALTSVFLRNFEIELMEDHYENDYTRLVVEPKKPCRIRYRRRK